MFPFFIANCFGDKSGSVKIGTMRDGRVLFSSHSSEGCSSSRVVLFYTLRPVDGVFGTHSV